MQARQRGAVPGAVVMGASAGGVEALLGLLAALPLGFAAPVLVVLHRRADPGQAVPSLASVLGRRCPLPVSEALDRQPLRPGEVIVAPADYHLLVDPGPVAALSRDTPVHHCRPAIDPLFESAAYLFGPALLALVLTGANDDGAEGAAAVRRAGGWLWVQTPATARVPTMPAAALAHAGADELLNLDTMACRLHAGDFWSTT
jgi:two-component system chemotaxis response regulator CheB